MDSGSCPFCLRNADVIRVYCWTVQTQSKWKNTFLSKKTFYNMLDARLPTRCIGERPSLLLDVKRRCLVFGYRRFGAVPYSRVKPSRTDVSVWPVVPYSGVKLQNWPYRNVGNQLRTRAAWQPRRARPHVLYYLCVRTYGVVTPYGPLFLFILFGNECCGTCQHIKNSFFFSSCLRSVRFRYCLGSPLSSSWWDGITTRILEGGVLTSNRGRSHKLT
jgi:hypothetical protein